MTLEDYEDISVESFTDYLTEEYEVITQVETTVSITEYVTVPYQETYTVQVPETYFETVIDVVDVVTQVEDEVPVFDDVTREIRGTREVPFTRTVIDEVQRTRVEKFLEDVIIPTTIRIEENVPYTETVERIYTHSHVLDPDHLNGTMEEGNTILGSVTHSHGNSGRRHLHNGLLNNDGETNADGSHTHVVGFTGDLDDVMTSILQGEEINTGIFRPIGDNGSGSGSG